VSGMIWRPTPQLRLVEWSGGVTGQLYFYWYRLRDSVGGYITPGWVEQNRSGCNVVRQTSSWATCRIRLRDGITWQAVADSMEALKVRTSRRRTSKTGLVATSAIRRESWASA